jgi:hypothetical protein
MATNDEAADAAGRSPAGPSLDGFLYLIARTIATQLIEADVGAPVAGEQAAAVATSGDPDPGKHKQQTSRGSDHAPGHSPESETDKQSTADAQSPAVNDCP